MRRKLCGQMLGFVFAMGISVLDADDGNQSSATDSASRPPNIVCILADDLGIGDVSIYGSNDFKTPHIDALAESGVRFTDGYVSHSVCSPSRVGLISGRNQVRHGWAFNPAGGDSKAGMSTQQRTFAQELKDLGYATGMVGKWHLGQQRQHHPMSRGFDEYFGILEGGSSYIDSRSTGVENGQVRAPTVRRNKVLRGFDEVKVDRYLTEVFTDEAVAFIDRHRNAPFLLYLSHITPHTPLQATRKYCDRYPQIEDHRKRVSAAMVASLDDSVGQVVAKLKATQHYENTLIAFLSDNGCAGYIGCCSNAPFRGFKRHHHVGGIRVPFILSWAAGLPAGNVYRHPVSSLDLMATFTGAAGNPKTTEDSVNLIPFLRGEQTGTPHQYLYWKASPTIAIRDQRWKLIRYNKTDFAPVDLRPDGRLQPPRDGWSLDSPHGQLTLLYDLENDPGETKNVAAEYPEIVNRLSNQHTTWSSPIKTKPILPPLRSILAEFEGMHLQLLF